MSLPKWIKDQFKELVKDEEFVDAVKNNTGYASEAYEAIEDLLEEEVSIEHPKGFIPLDGNNRDLFYDINLLKPLPKKMKFIVDGGTIAYDPVLGQHKTRGIPENATHVDYNKWVEFRSLTDDERAEQDAIREKHVQKSIESIIKWIKQDMAEARLRKARQEKANKEMTKTMNKSTLKTIEFSVTDEQLVAIKEILG